MAKNEEIKTVEELKPPMANPHDDGVRIDAFNSKDDPYAGKTKEELLEELGKEEGLEPAKAKVMIDQVSGEKTSNKIVEGQEDEDIIESLQDLDPEQFKAQLNELAKNNIRLLVPELQDDEEVEQVLEAIQRRIAPLTKKEIQELPSFKIKELVSTEVYEGIRKYNSNPVSSARTLLIDLKESQDHVNNLIDTMDEMKKGLEFLKKIDVDGINKKINDDLDKESDKYLTKIHRYREYLVRYIEKMKQQEGYEDTKFILDEIETAEKKIKAIDEAIDFRHIITKAKNLKEKMQKDFKRRNVVDKVIYDFIGKLNADPTMKITFPVPDDQYDDVKALTSFWIIFLELIHMYEKYPVLEELTHAEYLQMTQILYGNIKVTPKTTEEEKIIIDNLTNFAKEHNIQLKDIEQCKNLSIVFTYILAKTFKPNRLDNDTHMKYVLSYTMNILSQGLNDPYKSMVHGLIRQIRKTIS